MRKTLRSFLRSIGVNVVPGYRLTLLELLRFRIHLLGPASPLRIYGWWRHNLRRLVPSQRFLEASLDDLNATYPGKVDRQIMVIEALRNVAELRGAVVELGVHRGHTAIHLAKTMQDLGDTSRLYLFDSFQGLPENEGVWKQGDLLADPDEVTRRFQQFPHVTIVPGLFAETLPNLPQMPVKLAHVDADLYHSTKDANGWLLDRVVPGGIIIYDDYGFSTTPGVKQAVDEDFKPRSDYHRFYLPTGQLLAIKVPPP